MYSPRRHQFQLLRQVKTVGLTSALFAGRWHQHPFCWTAVAASRQAAAEARTTAKSSKQGVDEGFAMGRVANMPPVPPLFPVAPLLT